jgi:hypothetical protein
MLKRMIWLSTMIVILLTACVIAIMFAMRPSQSEDQDKQVKKMIELFRPDALDCPTLCWHGIRVGETSLDEVEQIVRADPSFTKVERGDGVMWGQQIDVLEVYKPLTVYEVIKIWGRPVGQIVHVCAGADSLHGEDTIYFKGALRINTGGLGLFGYLHAPDSPGIYLKPDTQTFSMIFFSQGDDPNFSGKYLRRWQGYRSWEAEDVPIFGRCDI